VTWTCRVIEDPLDPLVGPALRLCDQFWREALGPAHPGSRPSELPWRLTPVGGRRWARLVAIVEGDALRAAALQQLGWPEQTSSWVPWAIVAPEDRRLGIGRRLVEAVSDLARQDGQRLLTWNTPSDDEGSRQFSLGLGAAAGEVIEQNRVATSSLDRAVLESWVERAREEAAAYELIGWDGPCPEAFLDAFAALGAVMDDAPGTRPEPDVERTSTRYRQAEEFWLRRGPYWRLCARHREDGALAGYTELQPAAEPPWIAHQGDTGVVPAHRGRGLGRWLKAVNALRLLDERPEASAVETFNAAGNEPMLAINRAMGFDVVCRWRQWSLPI
jgi:GNAT superfamily N-acetyltransferase